MLRAIDALQSDFLTPAQVAASHAVMGLDRQLVADGTYFIVEDGNEAAGCGGWSFRATTYGGDHSAGRDARRLDPATEAAKVRAMYTDPAHVRRGVGRMVLNAAESAARESGFTAVELAATMAGVPLYRAAGYVDVEAFEDASGGVPVPLIRMRKTL